MEYEPITQSIKLAKQWDILSYTVLDKRKIAPSELIDVLRETYKVTKNYREVPLIPKELCKLLLSMDNFLYFASMIESKEVGLDFYHYVAVHWIGDAIKNGLFEDDFEYKFPNDKVTCRPKEMFVLNFENESDGLDYLTDTESIKNYAGIKLIGFDFIILDESI